MLAETEEAPYEIRSLLFIGIAVTSLLCPMGPFP